MNKFEIKSLTIKDFKGVTSQEFYEFGSLVVIQGDNFTGKTTIAEAILFALYGVDLQGSPRTDALVNKDLKRGKCEVSVVLETDQGEFKITRSATKLKKFVRLDKNEVSQKEVFEIVGEMDLFIISYLPSHALNFKDKEAREFFMKFVSEVEPGEVLKSLGAFAEPLEGLNLTNIDELKKDLRQGNKENETDLDFIDGKLSTINGVLKQVVNVGVGVDELEKEIEKLDNELYEPMEVQGLTSIVENKTEIKNQYESMMNISIEKPVFEVEVNDALEIQTELMNLQQPLQPNPTETVSMLHELTQVKKYYSQLKESLDELETVSNICPTCLQEIKDNAKNLEKIEEKKADIKKKMDEVVEEGKTLQTLLEKIQSDNEIYMTEYNQSVTDYKTTKEKLTKDYHLAVKKLEIIKRENQYLTNKYESDLSQARQEAKSKYDQLQLQLEKIEKENAAITEKNNNEQNIYRNEIKQQLSILRDELSTANVINQEITIMVRDIEKAKAEKLKLQQDIRNTNLSTEKNKAALEALNEYIGEYATMQSGQLNKYFNKVSIQLFEVTKTTGEMKPKFKLLYDEKPIEVLSLSERIRLGLEVSSFVKTITNTAYPTFVDNAESITHFDKIPGQLFTATVVKGSELIVN